MFQNRVFQEVDNNGKKSGPAAENRPHGCVPFQLRCFGSGPSNVFVLQQRRNVNISQSLHAKSPSFSSDNLVTKRDGHERGVAGKLAPFFVIV